VAEIKVASSLDGKSITLTRSTQQGEADTGIGDLLKDFTINISPKPGGVNPADSEVRISKPGGRINCKHAPQGADVQTGGGAIHIGLAHGFVKASTGGGNIDIDAVDGWVEVATGGGNVNVTMIGDPDDGRRDVSISSGRGDIVLTLPADLSMDLDVRIAYTRQDRQYQIISDFELRQLPTSESSSEEITPKKYLSWAGNIAGGKNRVKVCTSNGNIHLKKG